VALRRADEAPLPRAAEGRRTRGIHQAAADVAPLSNAGAFFSKNVRWWRVQQVSEKFELSFNFRPDGRSSLRDEPDSRPYVFRFDIRAPPGPVVCNHARPARPLLKPRKLRFHGELAWGEPNKTFEYIKLTPRKSFFSVVSLR
jgi:hypothetical protein